MLCEDTGSVVRLKPGFKVKKSQATRPRVQQRSNAERETPNVERRRSSLRSDRRLLLPQNVFLDFAGRSFGQLVDEGDAVWRFEMREIRARKI